MKWNAIITIVFGLIIIGAIALVALNLMSAGPTAGPGAGPGNVTVTTSPTPKPLPTKADVLQKFNLMKDKINSSGESFGGGSVQVVDGDEVAMVYIYKPAGTTDVSALLANGFKTVYSTFGARDPLLVGIVDTTVKLSNQMFKVDIYALERPVVESFMNGNITSIELAKQALLVTPQTQSLRANNSSKKSMSVDLGYNNAGSFTPPADRLGTFQESLNQSGYNKPLSLQAGADSNGQKLVSVAMALKTDADYQDIYQEIEAVFRACALGYGDFDRYLISLMPPGQNVNEYYYVDTPPGPALAYADGAINEYQLFNAINLTYYTK